MRLGRSSGSCRGADGIVRGARLGMVILLVLATPPPGFAGPSGHGPPMPDVLLQRLPGLRHAFAVVRRELRAAFGDDARAERMLSSEHEREATLRDLPATRRAQEAALHARAAARWTEFQRLVNAVLGSRQQRDPAYGEVVAALAAPGPSPIPADAAVLARDRIVLFMTMSGYGPGLVADVVTGRLSMQAVEQAAKLRLLGRSDAEIARYLEAQVVARAAVPSRATAETTFLARQRFDEVVVRHARHHDVDPDLVRAVIKHESAWNPGARSPKGALGLMQLMPDTARLLGVDPVDPERNIAGGVHYLADLRALFEGNLDAVLVAYVAGPTYAQRWLTGKTVLADEVRAYLDNVKASYGRIGRQRP